MEPKLVESQIRRRKLTEVKDETKIGTEEGKNRKERKKRERSMHLVHG